MSFWEDSLSSSIHHLSTKPKPKPTFPELPNAQFPFHIRYSDLQPQRDEQFLVDVFFFFVSLAFCVVVVVVALGPFLENPKRLIWGLMMINVLLKCVSKLQEMSFVLI